MTDKTSEPVNKFRLSLPSSFGGVNVELIFSNIDMVTKLAGELHEANERMERMDDIIKLQEKRIDCLLAEANARVPKKSKRS
ncbi:MAG TPA: hypothetical protein VIH30_06715 [Aquirhabdus sp.]